jgi:hypothetical protein
LSITRWSAKSLSPITRWRSFQISKFPKTISKVTKAAIPATSSKKLTTVPIFVIIFKKIGHGCKLQGKGWQLQNINLGRMGSTHLE